MYSYHGSISYVLLDSLLSYGSTSRVIHYIQHSFDKTIGKTYLMNFFFLDELQKKY